MGGVESCCVEVALDWLEFLAVLVEDAAFVEQGRKELTTE